jgi:hypothetical protein
MLLEFFAATQPFSPGEAYVSSMDGDEPGGNKQAYGPKYARVTKIKHKYDPTNFFGCTRRSRRGADNGSPDILDRQAIDVLSGTGGWSHLRLLQHQNHRGGFRYVVILSKPATMLDAQACSLATKQPRPVYYNLLRKLTTA